MPGLGQAVRDDAARRAAAHDDVIVCLLCTHALSPDIVTTERWIGALWGPPALFWWAMIRGLAPCGNARLRFCPVGQRAVRWRSKRWCRRRYFPDTLDPERYRWLVIIVLPSGRSCIQFPHQHLSWLIDGGPSTDGAITGLTITAAPYLESSAFVIASMCERICLA